MIKISKLADYGIVLLVCMVRCEDNGSYTARGLSDKSNLPLPMVSKVLKLLTRADLLASQRGVKGGYTLGRKPEEISIADIIRALEGPIALTSCLGHASSPCDIESSCHTRAFWEVINNRVEGALHTLSLAEMAYPEKLAQKKRELEGATMETLKR